MPKVFINEEETDLEISDYSCLLEILEKVYKEEVPADMVVIATELNNEKLSQERENELQNLSSEKIETLKISTMLIRDVAYKTIRDLSTFLLTFMPHTEKIAEQFRGGKEEEANKMYEVYLEDFQLFHTAIDHTFKVLAFDCDKEIVNEKSIDNLRKNILKITTDMHSSQEGRDWIMLADLLEYELMAVLEEWQEALSIIEKEDLNIK